MDSWAEDSTLINATLLPLKSGLFRTDIASILSAQTPLIKALERPSSYLACFCSKSEIITSRFATSCFSLLISEVNSSFNFRQISVALSLHTKTDFREGVSKYERHTSFNFGFIFRSTNRCPFMKIQLNQTSSTGLFNNFYNFLFCSFFVTCETPSVNSFWFDLDISFFQNCYLKPFYSVIFFF